MDIHGPASVRNAKTESKKHKIRPCYFFQVTKQPGPDRLQRS